MKLNEIKIYGKIYKVKPVSSLVSMQEVAALVVPEFVGNSAGGSDWTTNTYWGRNFFKLNSEYVGLVVLLLAGVSFFGARQRGVRLFLAGMGVIALLYALGAHTPVWHSAYALLPGIRLFRSASMVVFLFILRVAREARSTVRGTRR